MPNPSYTFITTPGTYDVWIDYIQGAFSLSYAVEFKAGATGSYTVNYTLDNPNDLAWTPIWVPDPTNGVAQNSTQGGYYVFRIRGLQVVVSAITGTIRFAVIQGVTA